MPADTGVQISGPDWGDPATVFAGDPLGSPLPYVALVLLVLYAAGVVAIRARGRRWSVPRSASFALGCVALAAATAPGIEAWGTRLFSVFMFQQLTLMIAVPPLLVLGSPGSLLLSAVPHRGVGAVVLRVALGALRSRAARVVLHAGFTVPLFLVAYYGLYLTGAADALVRSWAGHAVLETLFLVAGIVFAVPVLSSDPLPVAQSPLTSILEQFVEMGVHAFFGVIVMFGSTILVPAFAASTEAAGLDALADQRIAGGLAWSYGEGPAVLILIWVMHRWFRDDTRRALQRDRKVEREGDPELDAYNDYLAGLRDDGTPPER